MTGDTQKHDLSARLAALYSERDDRFEVLARAAGLDPAVDFRSRDLRALNFAAADLSGFNFTDCDLRGTALHLAAKIDERTIVAGAILDRADADWFDARLRETPLFDAGLVGDLRTAIDRQQFTLVFQPKVALRGGGVKGVEALVRWHHHERGAVSPSQFIPLLEDSGLIERLTLWMLEMVIEQQRLLVRLGFDLTIAVNISSALIANSKFIDDCRRLVAGQATALRFEINETALVLDPVAVSNNIKELTSIGISIAIDDYGAGYSSLAILKQLPAHELKIDRSFVHRLNDNKTDPLIVRSAIDLAHALGWEVTAEGVETASQLSLLSVMGCDAAQGFLIARPMSMERLVDFLRGPVEFMLPGIISESTTVSSMPS